MAEAQPSVIDEAASPVNASRPNMAVLFTLSAQLTMLAEALRSELDRADGRCVVTDTAQAGSGAAPPPPAPFQGIPGKNVGPLPTLLCYPKQGTRELLRTPVFLSHEGNSTCTDTDSVVRWDAPTSFRSEGDALFIGGSARPVVHSFRRQDTDDTIEETRSKDDYELVQTARTAKVPFMRSNSALASLGKCTMSARSSILSRRRLSFATNDGQELCGQCMMAEVCRSKDIKETGLSPFPSVRAREFSLWPSLQSLNRASVDAIHQGGEDDDLDTVFTASDRGGCVAPCNARISLDLPRNGGVQRFLQKLVMHPSSPKRMSWVAFSTFFVIFDVVMVPLSVFEMGGLLWALMSWARLLFWTADFPVSFFAGFHSRTELVMQVHQTARRYATTWMPFDLAMILIDWLLRAEQSLSEGDYDTLRALRLAKALGWMRILRTLRLLRLLKVSAMMRDAGVRGLTGYTFLIMGILQQISIILLLNHWIACSWYWLGSHTNGWVEANALDSQSGPVKYFTALHWSLTQFTPATMSVQPQNLAERIFAVAVLVFALITFSSFLSTITTLMTNLRNLNGCERAQLAKLEQYLHHHNVPFQLTVRIRRFADNLLAEERPKLEEQDVSLISKLSAPLRRELQYEQRKPVVHGHPFFRRFAGIHVSVVQQLYAESMEYVILCDGDVIFNSRDMALGMYFVAVGSLDYKHMGNGKSRAPVKDVLEPRQWCCEAALWTPWEHRGQMTASTRARLLRVNITPFLEILTSNPVAARLAASYGTEAVKCINVTDPEYLSDLDRTIIDSEWIARSVIAVNFASNNGGLLTPRFSVQGGLRNSVRSNSTGRASSGHRASVRGRGSNDTASGWHDHTLKSRTSAWIPSWLSVGLARRGASTVTDWRHPPPAGSRNSRGSRGSRSPA